MTKWWVDPAWDPMQDLQDCKEHIKHQHDILHTQGLQIVKLTEIVKNQSIEIACLVKLLTNNFDDIKVE